MLGSRLAPGPEYNDLNIARTRGDRAWRDKAHTGEEGEGR